MMPAIVPVKPWHLIYIGQRLRECDRSEIWASHHMLPVPGLIRAEAMSVRSWVGTMDDEPVCAFGVTPTNLLAGQGAPWMLATPKLHRGERVFLRMCRPVVDTMQSLFPELTNYVDARNFRTIRWLQWLGFDIAPAAPYGYDGLPFHRFSRSLPCADPQPC